MAPAVVKKLSSAATVPLKLRAVAVPPTVTPPPLPAASVPSAIDSVTVRVPLAGGTVVTSRSRTASTKAPTPFCDHGMRRSSCAGPPVPATVKVTFCQGCPSTGLMSASFWPANHTSKALVWGEPSLP